MTLTPPRSLAAWLMERAGRGVEHGRLTVVLPGGALLNFDGHRPGPRARLNLHSWRALWRVAIADDIGFAEAYLAHEWDSPDLATLLAFLGLNRKVGISLNLGWLLRATGRLRHWRNRNTRRGSRRNIALHYDLGNTFYAQWLDSGMAYSSALYTEAGQSLEQAQQAKLERIAALLKLSGGERVLEFGSGWGGLAQHLAERHACSVIGLTLSCEQLDYARHRLEQSPAAQLCDFRLQDYRDAKDTYDRVVSIEMLEAVGEAYWPVYFEKLRDRLGPGGIAVLQVITIDAAYYDGYRKRPDFIQRYIFPGGMLPTHEIMGTHIDDAGLTLTATECFGTSYAQTLVEWRNRFLQSAREIQALGFDARFMRMWEYYLAYCQAGFETGRVNVSLYRLTKA